MRNLLIATMLLTIGLFIVTCSAEESSKSDTTEVRVALDWFPWSNHSGLYIAKEKGYFSDQGLNVSIYTPDDPSTVLATVGAGQDEFGLSYQTEVISAIQQGVPIVSISALVQHPLNSVMALVTSGITRPRDLKGKKVGVTGLPADVPLLESMITTDGITLQDVETINVGFNLVPALISKKVDAIVGAYWVHESISAENLGFPVNIMRMEDWGVPDFYEIVLVTSNEMVDTNPQIVQSFVQAMVRGYNDAVADPQNAIDILKDAAPEIDESIERPGVTLLSPLWIEDETPFGWQTEEKWTNFAKWMKEEGLLPTDATFDPTKAFTNKFVEASK